MRGIYIQYLIMWSVYVHWGRGDREEFRSQIQSYIRLYGYLSQIITFSDIELEKSFVFLKYQQETTQTGYREVRHLRHDWPRLTSDSDHSWQDRGTGEYRYCPEPRTFGGGDVESVTDLLSEIINQVNNTYGINLTDDDKVDIERLRDRLVTDPEVIKYMGGQNTEDNKKNFFKEQFDEIMVDYVNERFEFYKKMDDNPSMKSLIFKMMYDSYEQGQQSA